MVAALARVEVAPGRRDAAGSDDRASEEPIGGLNTALGRRNAFIGGLNTALGRRNAFSGGLNTALGRRNAFIGGLTTVLGRMTTFIVA